MPEVRFRIRWPDGTEEECYSPSTVVIDAFTAGQVYELQDFLFRARSSLQKASDRVEARYGFHCSSALDQLTQIELRAIAFANDPSAHVTCLSMSS